MKRIISIVLSLVLLIGNVAAISTFDDGADSTTPHAAANATNHVLINTDNISYYKNGVNAVFINASERTTDTGAQRLQVIKQESKHLPVFAVVDYSDDLEQYKNTITQIVKQGYDGVLLKNIKYDDETQKQLLNTFKQENKNKQSISSQNNTLQTNIEFKKWQAEKLTKIINESAIEAKGADPDVLVGVYLYGVESGQNPIEILRLESVDLIIPAKGDGTGEVAFLTGPVADLVDSLTQPLKDVVCSFDPFGVFCWLFGELVDLAVDSALGDFISDLDAILGLKAVLECSVPIEDITADAIGLLADYLGDYLTNCLGDLLTGGYLDAILFFGDIIKGVISDIISGLTYDLIYSFVHDPMEDGIRAILCWCDFNVTSDINVNQTGWWNATGDIAFHEISPGQIQAAINNAVDGATIYVYNGSYNENVDVNKRITLIGEGADAVTLTAASADDHVFYVATDYVNISGFMVNGATETGKAGIYLENADYCNISNNKASDNRNGIDIEGFSNSNIIGNNNVSNNYIGIYLVHSSNNDIDNNNASANKWQGIRLHYSSNNNIANNIANSNNYVGIYLGWESNNNNNISNNTANSNNVDGIRLSSSGNNVLQGNTANSNTYYGIHLLDSNNNTIYHNNLINNTNSNAYDNRNNTWDNGYPSGGNYYSDYNGTDNNTDGISDISYSIPGGSSGDSVDRYPLMEPWIDSADAIPPSADAIPPTLEGCNGSEFVWYTRNASISPANPDGILDYLMINVSQFTESVNYILRIRQNNTDIHLFIGLNTTTINESWHGNSTNGTMVDDGIYTVELFASDLAGNNIAKTLGYVTVDNTPPYFTTVPALSTNIISPTTSPGINDSTTITANFSEPVGWKICAINSTNDVVSVDWCGGVYLQTSWNGTSSGFNTSMECQNMSYNSISEECDVIRITSCPPPRRGGGGGGGTYPVPWHVFPDGEYTISIVATDWVGNNVSCALQVTLSDSDENLRGDLNGDGDITTADCVIVLQIAAGSREHDPAADVNDDGQVTSLDALMILQAASGAIEL